MKTVLKSALAAAAVALTSQAFAQIVLYEDDNYGGRSMTTDRPVSNFKHSGFNDRASSIVVLSNRWEVCDDAGFAGRCIVLRQGKYPSLSSMGLNDRVSSVRAVYANAQVDESRYAPQPAEVYDYRRRPNERLYQADVIAVHAVVGPPEQRCWVERERVRDRNVPGTIVGGVIGGIIGHQVGGGFGRSLATAGGVVAGAAVGSHVGNDANVQDVQRCESTPSTAQPAFWDVTYNFRGLEHRVQMSTPPGATVTVNRQGEPRA